MRLTILHFLVLAAVAAVAGELPAARRIGQRTFPSVFQAWNGAAPVPGVGPEAMLARHDLAFLHPGSIGLVDASPHEGLVHAFDSKPVQAAQARRAELLAINPNLVLLAEVRYRDAPPGFLPDDSSWWKRDAQGRFVLGWAEGGYRLLDVESAEWRAQVARRAKAVMQTGAFDGIMLDWWGDDEARLELIRLVREAIGPDALILVNSNDRTIPKTAPYVNGLFMECYRSATPDDWKRISDTLRWAESHLRAPRVNCVETWFHQSRDDLNLMRAVTTLALTQSDGYCLFSDPNELPTPDHCHDWYPFWDRGLGRPLEPGRERPDGGWERRFSDGIAVYNPAGNAAITVRFEAPHRSRASGQSQVRHTVAPGDGDIFQPGERSERIQPRPER